jgi:Tfp pilus assembly protein PilN
MMKLPTLHQPLEARGFEVVRAIQWTLALVIVGSAAVAGWLWWDSRGLNKQTARYESAARRVQDANERAAQEAAKAGFDLSEAGQKTLSQDMAFTSHMLKQRAFSWTRFLSDLEEAVPPRVSIRSVALGATDATIALAGVALTLKDVTALVTGLENHPVFRNVVLSHHRIEGPSGADEKKHSRPTVDFTLTVGYRPLFSPLEGEEKGERP